MKKSVSLILPLLAAQTTSVCVTTSYHKDYAHPKKAWRAKVDVSLLDTTRRHVTATTTESL